jgi:hypothetical protein
MRLSVIPWAIGHGIALQSAMLPDAGGGSEQEQEQDRKQLWPEPLSALALPLLERHRVLS